MKLTLVFSLFKIKIRQKAYKFRLKTKFIRLYW